MHQCWRTKSYSWPNLPCPFCHYIPGLADQVSHPSVTEPVKPDPVDFFPSPSENLISPVSGEISNFTRPVCGFNIATIYNLCMFEKGETATWQKEEAWWTICRPGDGLFENSVRMELLLGLLDCFSVLADKDEFHSFIFAEMKSKLYDVNTWILPQQKPKLCLGIHLLLHLFPSIEERWMPKTEMLLISVDKVAQRQSPFAELYLWQF